MHRGGLAGHPLPEDQRTVEVAVRPLDEVPSHGASSDLDEDDLRRLDPQRPQAATSETEPPRLEEGY